MKLKLRKLSIKSILFDFRHHHRHRWSNTATSWGSRCTPWQSRYLLQSMLSTVSKLSESPFGVVHKWRHGLRERGSKICVTIICKNNSLSKCVLLFRKMFHLFTKFGILLSSDYTSGSVTSSVPTTYSYCPSVLMGGSEQQQQPPPRIHNPSNG